MANASETLPPPPHSPEGEPESRMMPNQVCKKIGEMIQDMGKQVSELGNLNTNDVLMFDIANVTCDFLEEIGKGSNGSTAFKGTHHGHSVALIRFPVGHVIINKGVVDILTGKQHQNIVHNRAVFLNQGFEVVLQELCLCSLNDFIYSFSIPTQFSRNPTDGPLVGEYKKKMLSYLNKRLEHIKLWIPDKSKSPPWMLVKFMRDMALGLEHLHVHKIVHGNLRLENILIAEFAESLVAKISDVGMTKYMHGHRASHAAACRSNSGWQAPELFYRGQYPTHQTDLFSLGCIFVACLNRGTHPYGDFPERDQNIKMEKKDLKSLMLNPEGYDLVQTLLKKHPHDRGTASKVLLHPFFWCPKSRMEFFRHLSDEAGRDNPNSNFLTALENKCQLICGENWKDRIDYIFVNKLRKYKGDSLVDLLRVIRNMWVHMNNLSYEFKELFKSNSKSKSIPMGFQRYFANKFPHLLMETYLVAKHYCSHDESFVSYFERNASSPSQLWNAFECDMQEQLGTLFST